MSSPSSQTVSVPQPSTSSAPARPAPAPEKKPFTIKIQGGIPF